VLAGTTHLTARPLRAADLDTLTAMHRDPAVMATLGGVRSAHQTRLFLSRNLAHWIRHGFGLWMFHARSEGGFVGRGGLRHVRLGGAPEIEVSYAVLSDFWGRGLASEMAASFLDVAFGRLALANVVAFTLPTNHGSRRVMEKLGFSYEREVIYTGAPHVLYRRHR
jgi:ribosomal-protein-alanine N-acetyltransferase